jgi:hypothetical protein
MGIMATINETDARLSTHEEVCAIRYESINARLKRLEQILMGTAAFVIVTLLTISLKI